LQAKYKKVAVGGTFEHFHRGHKALLSKAFELGEKVLLGISGEKLASRKGTVQSLEVRTQNVRDFLRLRGWEERAILFTLEDPLGPAPEDPELEAIVVSEETEPTAREINKLRVERGLKPLDIVVIPWVLADDGLPISSERVRRGEITPEGKVLGLRMDTRPSKDEYYLGIARSVAQRSPCIRRQFGAIVVREDVVVSTGYNGPARGVVNCMEVGCLKDEMNVPHYTGYEWCIGVHSEENAIANAARHGASVLGGTLYLYGQNYKDGSLVEGKPCDRCKRILINAGIKRVVTKRADGTIVKWDVEDWVREDTENYKRRLLEARRHGGGTQG
jgi:pantetheine-phosphate adenylyltransferase